MVSEGGLEPPRPIRTLGPQPSASANSATPTCGKHRTDRPDAEVRLAQQEGQHDGGDEERHCDGHRDAIQVPFGKCRSAH